MAEPSRHQPSSRTIVQRLNDRIRDAKRLGFTVRTELLDDEQCGWCELGGKRFVFLDLAQTASEQLQQLNETLDEYVSSLSSEANQPTKSVTGGVKHAA